MEGTEEAALIVSAEQERAVKQCVKNNDFDKIVVLYSIGKDSSCLLHLFKKAFLL